MPYKSYGLASQEQSARRTTAAERTAQGYDQMALGAIGDLGNVGWKMNAERREEEGHEARLAEAKSKMLSDELRRQESAKRMEMLYGLEGLRAQQLQNKAMEADLRLKEAQTKNTIGQFEHQRGMADTAGLRAYIIERMRTDRYRGRTHRAGGGPIKGAQDSAKFWESDAGQMSPDADKHLETALARVELMEADPTGDLSVLVGRMSKAFGGGLDPETATSRVVQWLTTVIQQSNGKLDWAGAIELAQDPQGQEALRKHIQGRR